MGHEDHLSLELDFWDDAVGAFEPAKVLREIQRTFPHAEIDPTDHQRVRLLRELGLFESQSAWDTDQRDTMIRQSWGLYQTNGPTYRFVIPFPSGHQVSGAARRLSVYFRVPASLPSEHRGELLSFLRSLKMGEPKIDEVFDDE
ncbi:hypothetical protein [Limnoglobus roseus]|uniref:Uncharacterized protein n=1 Tax=Limnoglobus roseus TaxID=2598579 RepID=A0A5C1A7M4_9BACT|nr:hypothetical protein [Limnoglobus roseus]QEL15299.1 hypothetical protein PX52LOC_02214 [Limnoglobus roseus]